MKTALLLNADVVKSFLYAEDMDARVDECAHTVDVDCGACNASSGFHDVSSFCQTKGARIVLLVRNDYEWHLVPDL